MDRRRMRDPMIWKFVGGVSAINGLSCFTLSSTFNMLFGKWGSGGILAYLIVGLIMWSLILRGKRIPVPAELQGLVAALIFLVICSISMVHDKLVAGEPDALSIISYGSFALMSVSMSRKFELGFESGFSAFFLQLFVAQLSKINLKLLPIAVVFCSVIIVVRHYSESGVLFGYSSPINGNHHPIEVGPPDAGVVAPLNSVVIDFRNNEDNNKSQDSPRMGEVSGQSLASRNNQKNDQEESCEAVDQSPTNGRGEVLEGSILSDLENQQNKEEEEEEEEGDRSSLPAESSGNSTVIIQNDSMQNSGESELMSAAASPLERQRRRKMRWMTSGIQNISSSIEEMLRLPGPHFSQKRKPSKSQDSTGMGKVSGQSRASTNNQQDNQEESSQNMNHSPRNGVVSEESILLESDDQQNEEEEEDRCSLAAESSEQDHVSSGNKVVADRVGGMPELISRTPLAIRRGVKGMTGGIQTISNSVGGTLRRRHLQVARTLTKKNPKRV